MTCPSWGSVSATPSGVPSGHRWSSLASSVWPSPPEASPLAVVGGHTVCVFGYTPVGLVARNSYGASWGVGGEFMIPWGTLGEHGVLAASSITRVDD